MEEVGSGPAVGAGPPSDRGRGVAVGAVAVASVAEGVGTIRAASAWRLEAASPRKPRL